MLEMPANNLLPASISYTTFANAYLPSTGYNGIITPTQQKNAQAEADKELRKEKFYIVTDVASGNIIACNGVHRWLGYSDKSFSVKKLSELLEPSHAVAQAFYAAALYQYSVDTGWHPQWNVALFSSALVIKAASGKYWYCKRDCYPFQFDNGKKIISLLHEITLIKEHQRELFWMQLHHDHSKANDEFYTRLKKLFTDNGKFSSQESRMIKRYAHTENSNRNSIAKAFKIEKATVDTYNKRIIKKTEEFFFHRFDNAKQASQYFKHVRLI